MSMDQQASRVQVFCRVAPYRTTPVLPGSINLFSSGAEEEAMRVGIDGEPPRMSILVADPVTGATASTACCAVLDDQSTQADVFNATAAGLVARAVAQQKQCAVLAYGQTASGKTHTMFGPRGGAVEFLEDQRQAGIVPRVIEAVFSHEACSQFGVRGVDIAFFEIYNETAIDHVARCFNEVTAAPLPPAATRSASREMSHHGAAISRSQSNSSNQQLAVTYKATDKSRLLRLVQRARCNTADECRGTLRKLAAARLTATTEMNETSSRSHVVIQLYLLGANAQPLGGSITLVDLAGSECLKTATHADVTRVQESRSINVSLLALKKVVRALRTRSDYVPFKESMLTAVLEPSLVEADAAALIACFSTQRSDGAETMATLKFAKDASLLPVMHGVGAAVMMERLQESQRHRQQVQAHQALNAGAFRGGAALPFACLAPRASSAATGGGARRTVSNSNRKHVTGGTYDAHQVASTNRRVDFSTSCVGDGEGDDDDVDEDDIETLRQLDSESPQRHSSPTSELMAKEMETLRSQVRGLAAENEKLRREKAKIAQELAECRKGAMSLLTQCDRLATEFTEMQEQFHEVKAKNHEQEHIIHCLRLNSKTPIAGAGLAIVSPNKISTGKQHRGGRDDVVSPRKALTASPRVAAHPAVQSGGLVGGKCDSAPTRAPSLGGTSRSPPQPRQWLAPLQLDAVPLPGTSPSQSSRAAPLPKPVNDKIIDADECWRRHNPTSPSANHRIRV